MGARGRKAIGRSTGVRLAVAVVALTLAGLSAGSAQAAPTSNPHGKFLGVVARHLPGAASPNAASPNASPRLRAGGNLAYNGGPVMHSDANYAIFWEPSGHATTDSYKSVIQSYFSSVAADSGLGTNVYAVNTEYYDIAGGSTRPIAYSASSGGTIIDSQPYPSSGCPQLSGAPCLTDAQIAAEVSRVAAANHTPHGLGAVYYVFFPPNVGSCFNASRATCSYTYFCAYHSSTADSAGVLLYADMPYAAVPGCDPGQRPNGDPADPTLNVVSHENNETITDPLGNAWYDAQGEEIGDKCSFVFGAALGGSSGASYNQVIAGHDYWLQEEWSNAAGGCIQRTAAAPPADEAPTAAFGANPSPAIAGAPVSFSGAASSDPDGTITAYSWSFGDGATATGSTPSHVYAQAGAYSVTLRVTDSSGLSASASQTITVNPSGPPTDESPTAAFTFTKYANTTLARFAGSGSDPDGSIRRYSWAFGDGTSSTATVVLHRFPKAGTYTVTLTVTDSSNLTASVTHTVTVP